MVEENKTDTQDQNRLATDEEVENFLSSTGLAFWVSEDDKGILKQLIPTLYANGNNAVSISNLCKGLRAGDEDSIKELERALEIFENGTLPEGISPDEKNTRFMYRAMVLKGSVMTDYVSDQGILNNILLNAQVNAMGVRITNLENEIKELKLANNREDNNGHSN